MQASSILTTIRGVQQQIKRAYQQTKYTYCVQLVEYVLEMLDGRGKGEKEMGKGEGVRLRDVEVNVRSLKGLLCVKYLEREEEGEMEFKMAESIDELNSTLLRRKLECYVYRKQHRKALQCCQDLLLNQPDSISLQNKHLQLTSLLSDKSDQSLTGKKSKQKKSKTQAPASPLKVRFGSFQIIQFKDLQKDDTILHFNPEFKQNQSNEEKSVGKSNKSILKDSSSYTSGLSTQHVTDEMMVQNKQGFSLKKLKFLEKGMKGGQEKNKQEEGSDGGDGQEKEVKIKKQMSMHEKETEQQKTDVGVHNIPTSQKKPGLKKSKSVAFRTQDKD